MQAVIWHLRYPLSRRDLENMFAERGIKVDYSTVDRWARADAPMSEKRLRRLRKPHCGLIRVDEIDVKIRGEWRALYRAFDKHGAPGIFC